MHTLTKEAVIEALREYEYSAFGLRVFEEPPEDGDILEPSRVWVDGEPTDEILSGTSAVRVYPRVINGALKELRCYQGEYVALLGSNVYEDGEDAGEVVLEDAQVLEIWRRK
jgi:hypothetical protein